MFGPHALKPKPPVIRKVPQLQSNGVNSGPGKASANLSLKRSAPRGPPPNRFNLTPSTKARPVNPLKRPTTAGAQEPRKKKRSETPIQKFSADGSDDSGEERRLERARLEKKKQQLEKLKLVDKDRVLRDTANWSPGCAHGFELTHCSDVTLGKYAKDFLPIFDEEDVEISLQYPSFSRLERFRLVKNREREAFEPWYDISETIKTVLEYYIPQDKAAPLLDESSGILRRLRRALNDKNFPAYKAAVEDYSSFVRKAVDSGDVATKIDKMLPLDAKFIERFMTQIYSRIVSPRVNEVKAYSAASDNVYGELLYPFCSQIFKETGLKSKHIFLDLGSGVGNVVLQAALEIGCESWGIEMMPASCSLAEAQAKEFTARTRLWGLRAGDVHLLSGDFFKHSELHAVLRCADVVLVNNQAFQPETNAKLLNNVLLDLKEGARLVSLKSFGPDFQLKRRTSEHPVACFEMERKEFHHNWVSWTNASGEYTVATKDSTRITRFLESHGSA